MSAWQAGARWENGTFTLQQHRCVSLAAISPKAASSAISTACCGTQSHSTFFLGNGGRSPVQSAAPKNLQLSTSWAGRLPHLSPAKQNFRERGAISPNGQPGHRRNDVCLRSPLRFQCVSLNGRQPLCNGREEALHFFPQVRDRLAIAREMSQQASLEQSIKQRIEGAPGDDRLSATK